MEPLEDASVLAAWRAHNDHNEQEREEGDNVLKRDGSGAFGRDCRGGRLALGSSAGQPEQKGKGNKSEPDQQTPPHGEMPQEGRRRKQGPSLALWAGRTRW